MRAEVQAALGDLRAEDVARAAGVCEQVMDGDVGGDRPVRVVGEMLSDGVLEPDLSRLNKLQHGDRGEHLVHGAVPEFRVECVGDAGIAIGEAIRSAEQHPPLLRNEHRSAELAGGHPSADLSWQHVEQLLLTDASWRELDGRRNQHQAETDDAVRWRGLDFDREPGEPVRFAFLHEAGDPCVGRLLTLMTS